MVDGETGERRLRAQRLLDLAHLALFLWASVTSCVLWFALREFAAASRRFDDFVRELSRFNRKAGRRD